MDIPGWHKSFLPPAINHLYHFDIPSLFRAPFIAPFFSHRPSFMTFLRSFDLSARPFEEISTFSSLRLQRIFSILYCVRVAILRFCGLGFCVYYVYYLSLYLTCMQRCDLRVWPGRHHQHKFWTLSDRKYILEQEKCQNLFTPIGGFYSQVGTRTY